MLPVLETTQFIVTITAEEKDWMTQILNRLSDFFSSNPIPETSKRCKSDPKSMYSTKVYECNLLHANIPLYRVWLRLKLVSEQPITARYLRHI